MSQPRWKAEFNARLDEIRIAHDGRMEPLVDRVRSSLTTHRLALVTGLGDWRDDCEAVKSNLLELSRGLGELLPQSPLGEFIRDVRDYSDSDQEPDRRGHRSAGAMQPHTDPSTLLVLHCLCPAKLGGETQLVNILAIHDHIRARRSNLLPRLYEPYRRWKQAGVLGESHEGPSPFKRTVFSERDGVVSCIWDRSYIDNGAALAGETLRAEQIEALDLFEQLSRSPDFVVRFTLSAGETLILHNRSVLHARSDYEDWDEPERRRHLLRVWIDAPEQFPVAPDHELGNLYEPSK